MSVVTSLHYVAGRWPIKQSDNHDPQSHVNLSLAEVFVESHSDKADRHSGKKDRRSKSKSSTKHTNVLDQSDHSYNARSNDTSEVLRNYKIPKIQKKVSHSESDLDYDYDEPAVKGLSDESDIDSMQNAFADSGSNRNSDSESDRSSRSSRSVSKSKSRNANIKRKREVSDSESDSDSGRFDPLKKEKKIQMEFIQRPREICRPTFYGIYHGCGDQRKYFRQYTHSVIRRAQGPVT